MTNHFNLSPPVARDLINSLTPRERDVAERMAMGMYLKEVADDLGISPKTVEVHLRNLKEKLNVTTHGIGRVWFCAATMGETETHARKDQITEARYVEPSQMFLHFADGFKGTWTFEKLELNMSNMKPATIKASDSGAFVEVRSKWGDKVQLDLSSLRATVDRKYAAEIEDRCAATMGGTGA